MTPLPFLLYPFFSIPPSSPCAQTSQPFLSSPNAFHSFLHLFHLLPLSLSLPLLFCLPSYFRVRGRCNAGPNLSYLCLSPKQPSGFNTVVCGWTCAPDTRPQGELGDWLRDWSTTGLLHKAARLVELRQRCLYRSAERGNVFPKWLNLLCMKCCT